MTVFLLESLRAHRRGRILQQAIGARAAEAMPDEAAIVLLFGSDFQSAPPNRQSELFDWARSPGRVLLLVPPFSDGENHRPVSWWVERMDGRPLGGEGLSHTLAGEVSYRLRGQLQTPAIPGATWSDASPCVGVYRAHPGSGLFAVTCLPLWSLTLLDLTAELTGWLESLVALAGRPPAARDESAPVLTRAHYGLLLFLLSQRFETQEQALEQLGASPIFRFDPEQARSLFRDLRNQGLVTGAQPTEEAARRVAESPYALYLDALREEPR